MDGIQFNQMLASVTAGQKLSAGTGKAECFDENTFAGYLDEKLAQPERTEVEGHMAACDTCRTEMYDIKMLLDAQKNDVPDTLVDAVKKNLSTDPVAATSGRKVTI